MGLESEMRNLLLWLKYGSHICKEQVVLTMVNKRCRPLPTSLKERSFQFHGKYPLGSHRSRLKPLFSGKHLIETMPFTVKLGSSVSPPSRSSRVGLGRTLPEWGGRAEKQSGQVRSGWPNSDRTVCPTVRSCGDAEMREQVWVWSWDTTWPPCNMATGKSLKISNDYNSNDTENANKKFVIPSNVKKLKKQNILWSVFSTRLVEYSLPTGRQRRWSIQLGWTDPTPQSLHVPNEITKPKGLSNCRKATSYLVTESGLELTLPDFQLTVFSPHSMLPLALVPEETG